MTRLLERRRSVVDPAQGLMRAEHFQMAYATNDIDRACAIFSDQYGIKDFGRLEGQLPAGGHIRVELAWAGTIMYELMTAEGPGSAIYMDRLPAGGFVIKHHHLGYLLHDQAQWDALMARAGKSGHRLAHQNNNAGFMRSCFIEVQALGHYLEYILPEPAGLAFFQNVPANSVPQ